MSACPAIGELQVGGRPVASFHCELEAGHERRRWDDPWAGLLDADRYAAHNRAGGGSLPMVEGTPHRYTLEWADSDDVMMLPDAELFDPDERFDVELPFP